MLVPLAFLILMLFLAFNGIVMAASPRKWMATSNRVTRWAWGSEHWFRFSLERLTRWDVLQWRVAGGAMALICGSALVWAVNRLWVSPGAASRLSANAPPDGPGSKSMAFWQVFLAMWAVYGLLLVVTPRRALRLFGTWRSMDMPAPALWVWRVIGVAIAGGCIYIMMSFATAGPAG